MVKKTTTAPVKGNRIWYFLQSVDEELGSEATLPAYQTSGGMTIGGEDIDEQTKQGRIILKNTDEHSVELTQYFVPGDPAIDMLEEAKVEGKSVKVWRVVVDPSVRTEGTSGQAPTYPAHFGYGRPDEISTDEGDGLVEVSYTLNIIGRLKKGQFPLSDEDVAMIESVYEYQNPGETTGDYDAIESAPVV